MGIIDLLQHLPKNNQNTQNLSSLAPRPTCLTKIKAFLPRTHTGPIKWPCPGLHTLRMSHIHWQPASDAQSFPWAWLASLQCPIRSFRVFGFSCKGNKGAPCPLVRLWALKVQLQAHVTLVALNNPTRVTEFGHSLGGPSGDRPADLHPGKLPRFFSRTITASELETSIMSHHFQHLTQEKLGLWGKWFLQLRI